MSQDLRRQTNWLASAGYLAAAPDLYRAGRRLACISRIMHDACQRRGLTFDDIEAVRTWLTAREDCTSQVGVIGYCMGGGFALMLAPAGGLCAASVNYGHVIQGRLLRELSSRRLPHRRQLWRQGPR
jgi:carboxymethylenebutenolidase